MKEHELRDLLPAERQLPAGRRRDLKERLMEQIDDEDRGARTTFRYLVVGAAAVVLVVAGLVAVLVTHDGDDAAQTPAGTDRPAVTTPTTPTTPTTGSSTTTSTTTTTTKPADSMVRTACTRGAVAASLGYRAAEVQSDPVCHDGWGWIDACPASERDAEVGCLEAGKIIRLQGGRWRFVAALLQDCAESFTAYGAPPEVADSFFRRCDTPGG